MALFWCGGNKGEGGASTHPAAACTLNEKGRRCSCHGGCYQPTCRNLISLLAIGLTFILARSLPLITLTRCRSIARSIPAAARRRRRS